MTQFNWILWPSQQMGHRFGWLAGNSNGRSQRAVHCFLGKWAASWCTYLVVDVSPRRAPGPLRLKANFFPEWYKMEWRHCRNSWNGFWDTGETGWQQRNSRLHVVEVHAKNSEVAESFSRRCQSLTFARNSYLVRFRYRTNTRLTVSQTSSTDTPRFIHSRKIPCQNSVCIYLISPVFQLEKCRRF